MDMNTEVAAVTLVSRLLETPRIQEAQLPDEKVVRATLRRRVREHPKLEARYQDFLDDEVDDSEMFDDFLETDFGLTLRDGLIDFYRVDDFVDYLLKGQEVLIYHLTSTALLPQIKANGLLPGAVTGNKVNPRFDDPDPENPERQPHVFLTTNPNSVPYDRWAVGQFGGDEIVLEVRARYDRLEFDPDDDDIDSGRFQYVVPYVPPQDILNLP